MASEKTGTSVGVITLDLRIAAKLNEQMQAIAAGANQSAQRSFEGLGKTVEQSISKPVERAGKVMEQAISAPVEKATQAVKAPLQKMTDQFEQSADEIQEIAERAAKRWADSISPKPGPSPLPTTAPKIVSSADSTAAEAAQYMANWDPISLKLKEAQQRIEDIPKVSEAAAQKTGNIFSRLAGKIKSVFTSASKDVQDAEVKVFAGAQDAVAKSAGAVEKAENRKRGFYRSTARMQANAVLSAVTSTSKGIARVGVLGRALSASLAGSFAIAGPLAIAAAAFAVLSKSISLANVNSSQFKNSLNEVKANLQVAFTPIFQAILPALNALMSGLAAVTRYIATFISAIFGKTYAQSLAATKQMQKNATDAKAKSGSGSKDKGSLAGFDELNVIGQKSNSAAADGIDYDAINSKGSTAAARLAEKFKAAWQNIAAGFNDYVVQPIQDNLYKFDAPIERFKALFAGIGQQCRAWVEPLSRWFQTDLKSAVAVGIGAASTILAGFMDSLAMVAETIWKTLQPAINWVVTKGLPMLTDIFVEVSKTAVTVFDVLKTVFDTLWQGVIAPFAQFVSKAVTDVLNLFSSLWEQYGASTFDKIRAAISSVKDLFLNIWNNFLAPIFGQIFQTLDQLWTEHLLPLIGQIGEFVLKLVNGALEIYNGFVAPIVNWFVAMLGPKIAAVIGTIVQLIGGVVGTVADAATNILKALGGVLDFVVGVFTGNWEKAWNGVKEIFKGVFGALYDIAKTPINGIIWLLNGLIEGINAVIGQLNKIHVDIPDWVPTYGGKSFGIHLPLASKIPYLAKGGILEQPTLAMMGEYPGAKSNPEIATPQSLMQETFLETMIPLLNELVAFREDVLQLLREIIAKDPSITLDGTTLSRLLKPYLDEENKRVGGTIY
nr:MAG TPA: minor tail protein [Caudoviricetes sp.]